MTWLRALESQNLAVRITASFGSSDKSQENNRRWAAIQTHRSMHADEREQAFIKNTSQHLQ